MYLTKCEYLKIIMKNSAIDNFEKKKLRSQFILR